MVTPSAESEAEAAKPPLLAYVGALAEYRVYLTMQAMAAQEAMAELSSAVAAGDADKARQAYLTAHQAYGHVKPMGDLFTDLDTQIDVRPEYLQEREADPAFVGFYQIGRALFGSDDVATLAPAVAALSEQIDALAKRVRSLDIQPPQIAALSARSLQRLGGYLEATEWPLAEQAELDYANAVVEGSQSAFRLLEPVLTKAAPDVFKQTDEDYAAVLQALAPYLDDSQSAELGAEQRKELADQVHKLSASVGSVNAALSLD